MSGFHDRLSAVHDEIWRAGTEPSDTLGAMLAALGAAEPPEGVYRLPTARMTAGPHLAAQDDRDTAGAAGGDGRRRAGAIPLRHAAR